MSITLHDVARLAGVSIKTVSNVINDYPHIRPATRTKVEAAIEQLGYQPNLSARSLRSGRSGVISLLIPDLRNAYFAELADAVMRAAQAKGLSARWQGG
jgi:DNA-binding LacI/PurR family transcriptional regulator